MSKVQWKRARLTGRLKVTSPLHIGDGHIEEQAKGKDGETVLESRICQDINGCPYIPASSLRGALRALTKSGQQRDKLFGFSGEGDNEGRMGALRCYDATSRERLDAGKDKITRTSINPKLGVALNHHLFNMAVVPTGFTFDIEFELDDITEADIASLAGAIELLNQSGNGLGRGKRTGQGRLQWKLDNLAVIGEEQLKQWVTSTSPSPSWQALKHFPQPDYQHCISLPQQTMNFTIEFTSPWLVNDPTLVSPEKSIKDNKLPKLEFSRRQNHALLPASSLKGWLRHQALRILQTLLEEHLEAEKNADTWLADIFGDTQQASWLTISDALSDSEVTGQLQTFNAVDRFTGGVKDTALYTVRAAPPCEVKGTFGVTSYEPSDWRLGLLLLIIRDAMEGDLVMGWGKAKGYGQAKLSLHQANKTVSSWQEATELYGSNLQAPIQALAQKIDNALTGSQQEVANV